MKIAIVAASLPESGRKLGGVEVFIHRLANQLASDPHHEVTVFSLSDRPADAQYDYQRLFPGLSLLRRRKIFVWFIYPWLLNFFQFKNFEIIHFFGDDWFYFLRSQPSLRTMNGSALNEARTATSLKRKLIQYLIYPLEHLSVKLATLTVGIGKDSQQIYNLEKIINIGVNQTRFHPGEKTPNPTLLFVGTWQGRKRGQFIYDRFIETILPKLPTAKLIMVADTCPPHPQVVAVEFPDDATLAQLYREAWVFAYPSVYEGFGMPYVEALASGTAIVTSPNSGADSILCNGQYGAIVEDELFAQTVLDLLCDPAKRFQQEQVGLTRAAQFNWAAIAQDYMQTYQTAIDRFHARTAIAPVPSKDT